MSGIPGPLGNLPGLSYDPVTNRYFAIPKVQPGQVASSSRAGNSRSSENGASSIASGRGRAKGKGRMLPPTICVDDRGDKRIKLDPEAQRLGRRGAREPRAGMIIGRRGKTRQQFSDGIVPDLRLASTRRCNCGHTGEVISSIQAYGSSAFYATTEHGRVLVHKENGTTYRMQVCAQNIVALHVDIPRMVMMAISTGTEAHIHHFRRLSENPNETMQSEIDLPVGEVFAASSFDDACTLGGERGLSIVKYTNERNHSIHRRLKSDVLAVDHMDRNLVYAGLRNSSVVLDDLRVSPRQSSIVAHTLNGKAVINVKKLSDTVVPWGVAVSGMSDELMIFDARFGRSPLHKLEGHVNNYRRSLGMTTTPDDAYILHAGSDNRIRAWSTQTGRRVVPGPDIEDLFSFTSPDISRMRRREKTPYRHWRDRSTVSFSELADLDDDDDIREALESPGPGGDMSGILDIVEGEPGSASDSDLSLLSVDGLDDDGAAERNEDEDSLTGSDGESDEGRDELSRRLTRGFIRTLDPSNRSVSQSPPPARYARPTISSTARTSRATRIRDILSSNGTRPPARLRPPQTPPRRPSFLREGTTSPAIPGRIAKDETNVLRRVFAKRVVGLSFHPDSWALDVAVGEKVERFTAFDVPSDRAEEGDE